jgi:hypothetical protein
MSIQKRCVFYSKENQYRFLDWAEVTTTLGSMMEPFCPNIRFAPNQSIRDFDPSDPIARIDEMKNVDRRFEWKALSHGEVMPLHGGRMMPHVNIATGNF